MQTFSILVENKRFNLNIEDEDYEPLMKALYKSPYLNLHENNTLKSMLQFCIATSLREIHQEKAIKAIIHKISIS